MTANRSRKLRYLTIDRDGDILGWSTESGDGELRTRKLRDLFGQSSDAGLAGTWLAHAAERGQWSGSCRLHGGRRADINIVRMLTDEGQQRFTVTLAHEDAVVDDRRHHVAGLELLANVAHEIMSRDVDASRARQSTDIDILRRLAKHLDCESCSHYLVDGDDPQLGAISGMDSKLANLDRKLSACCIATGETCHSSCCAHDEATVNALCGCGVRTYATSPLIAAGRVVGTMNFYSKTRPPFDASELDFIRTASQLFAASVASRAAGRALADNERRFRTLVDSAADAIFVIDEDSRFVDVNAEACRSLGYSREELLQMSVCDIEVMLEHEVKQLGRMMLPPNDPRILRGIHLRKDGTCFPVEIRCARAEIDGSLCTIAIARNIADRKLLEEQLIQSQKMEAVGLLAGGIAHDFNNLLTVINTTAEMLLENAAVNDALEASLSAIQHAGERAADLTAQLLLFSRKSQSNVETVDLASILLDCENLLRRVIGEDIELDIRHPESAVVIRADARQIDQVLMNLAINARDAMPDGGKLVMRVRKCELDGEAVAPGLPAGNYAEVVVSDTGWGMNAEVRQRAFEPFFSTKDIGAGTGLGLSVVYGIVHDSNGDITVESTPGVGTIFRIFFPLADETPKVAAGASEQRSVHGSEVVLLVEDEDLVRSVVRTALERFGYSVLEASSAHEAVNLATEHAQALSLVLTDVVMPDVDGPALAENLRANQPDLKVLFMSGYSEEAIERRVSRHPLPNLIRKPFTAAHLAKRVRYALDTTA